MPKPKENLKGKKFGLLTVKKDAPSQTGKSRWECKCKCGNTVVVFATNLKNGRTTSCGCVRETAKREGKSDIHTGMRFGYLFIWGYVGMGKYAVTCSCTVCRESGTRTFHFFTANELTSGRRKTCGKSSKQSILIRLHPDEYRSYRSMLNRATDPKNKDYAGKGIGVAEELKPENSGFEFFWLRLGPRPEDHSVERIDPEKGYELGNLEWADRRKQNSNKTTSRFVRFEGRKINVTHFAQEIGKHHPWVTRRLDEGMTPDEIAIEAGYEIVTI